MCVRLGPPLAVNQVSEEVCDSDERTPPASQQRDRMGAGGRKRDRKGKKGRRESQMPEPESESHSDASGFVALMKTSSPNISLGYTLITKGGQGAALGLSRWKKRKGSGVVIMAKLQKAPENPRHC